jgi:O-antigen/teichoic acid export membrane protein
VDGESTPEEASDRPPANASKGQLARNMASSYVSLFVGIVLSLFFTRVVLRHLGASTYGLWIVLFAMVGYLGLLDVGVGTAVVQRIARLMGEHDDAGVADLMRTAWWFFATSGVVAVLVTVVVAPFIGSILHLGTLSPTAAAITLVLLGAMTAVLFLQSVPNAVLFGSGRADRSAQVGLLTLILTQGAQIVVVVAGGGLVGLAVVAVVGAAIGLGVGASLIHRITGSSIRHGRFNRPLLRELLAFGGRQSVISLSGIVSYQLDALIIGIILPVAQVAPYNIALSTANLSRNLSTQGTNLLLPTFAHFETVGDRERQARFFFRSVMFGLAVAFPIVIALAGFGDPILTLWLGTVPPKTYEIMIVLGVVTAVQLPGNQCFNFLTGVGRVQLIMRLAIIGAVVNLAGSVAATFWLGPVGPAVGSLPVVVVLDFTLLPVIVCRYVGVPVARYLREALLPLLPTSIAGGTVALALVEWAPARTGVGAVVEATVTVAASWLALGGFLLRVEPTARRALWSRLRRR